jgi:hypothetical protein
MSHDDDVWDLNSVAELGDQIIYLKIILVRILRKITYHASTSAELLKLLEDRLGAGFANGYDVHLKINALCIILF